MALLLHGNTIAQPFQAARCDLFVRRNAILDLNQITFGLSELNDALFGVTVLDDKQSTHTGFRYNRSRRHEHCGRGALMSPNQNSSTCCWHRRASSKVYSRLAR